MLKLEIDNKELEKKIKDSGLSSKEIKKEVINFLDNYIKNYDSNTKVEYLNDSQVEFINKIAADHDPQPFNLSELLNNDK